MSTNVAQILRQGALRTPNQLALISLCAQGTERTEHTYAELDRDARRVAHGLQQAGVRPGDRLALCAENNTHFVTCWFGALYAGCELVPVPILSAPPEVAFRVARAKCRGVIHDAKRQPLVEKALATLDATAIRPQTWAAETLSSSPGSTESPVATPQTQSAMILYTSGTTGESKGAAISHGALLMHTAVLTRHALRLERQDRVLGVLPLTHSYGCRMVLLATFYVGGCAVLLPRFAPETAMEVMVREGITWLPAVPTMLAALGDLPPGPTPALRWIMSAGAPLPDEVVRRAEKRLGAEVRQGFGMTEATIATLNAPPDARTLGSVGQPVWGVEISIRDEQGQPLATGTPGEVWIRGHNMMSHYLDDPEGTERAVQNGYMRSGDVGFLDDAGRLSIIDRIKDLIIRGGHNVYPAEVENALSTHPAVKEVAVIGQPDAYYGEEVVAVVVLRPDTTASAEELMAWAGERVAKPKIPRRVLFREALPVGPSGKVLKRTLRAELNQKG